MVLMLTTVKINDSIKSPSGGFFSKPKNDNVLLKQKINRSIVYMFVIIRIKIIVY
jgi:hypothetical protein